MIYKLNYPKLKKFYLVSYKCVILLFLQPFLSIGFNLVNAQTTTNTTSIIYTMANFVTSVDASNKFYLEYDVQVSGDAVVTDEDVQMNYNNTTYFTNNASKILVTLPTSGPFSSGFNTPIPAVNNGVLGVPIHGGSVQLVSTAVTMFHVKILALPSFGNTPLTDAVSFNEGNNCEGPTGVTISADPTSITSGSSTDLTVNITGGTPPYTVVYSNGTDQSTYNGL